MWPREVAAATTPGAADPELARYVEARGLQVIGGGLLTLRARDRSRIGNIMGTIMLGQSIGKILRRTLWLGRAGAPLAKRNGAVVTDALSGIELGRSSHDDVVRLCGAPQEERRRLGGRQRTLVYRGSVLTAHPRFAFRWFSTVSRRELEHHEVVIEIEDDRVRDVESRISRSKVE